MIDFSDMGTVRTEDSDAEDGKWFCSVQNSGRISEAV